MQIETTVTVDREIAVWVDHKMVGTFTVAEARQMVFQVTQAIREIAPEPPDYYRMAIARMMDED